MTSIRSFILSMLMIVFMVASSEASWLIYHKPEFKGRVIDAETEQPIEGGIVVVVYYKHSLISGPGGGYTSVVKVKETLTDKNGEFHFPSFTTLIQPNSIEDYARFIIYKPGYGNFPDQEIVPYGLPPVEEQAFFSKEIGSKGELEMWVKAEKGPELKMSEVTFGIVELSKLKTRVDREKARMAADIFGADFNAKDLPLLYKMVNEERKSGF